jgi:hypothetical protein
MSTESDSDELKIVAPHFDTRFYLEANPDVAAAGADPLTHFMIYGWRERRNPSAAFNVAYYLRAYPDVAVAQINPLLHYALFGAAEGRQPRRPLDAERSLIETARSPTLVSGEWTGAWDRAAGLDRETMSRQLAAVVESSVLVVSFSHDDYHTNIGGVQNLVREEWLAFEELGASYLHVSPTVPLSTLSDPTGDDSVRLSLRLGGEHLGSVCAGNLLAALAEVRRSGVSLLLIVHHFLGHQPETLVRVAALSEVAPIAWIHDYFTLCPNFNLLRNNIRFCGGPPLNSTACEICVYGEDRLTAHGRIQMFFDTAHPWVLAPSEVALKLWSERANLPCRGSGVQECTRLVLDSEVVNRTGDISRPLRIAHLGARSHIKGWTTYQRLMSRFSSDSRYVFFQLGMPCGAEPPRELRQVPVRVAPDAPDAMIEAIADNGINVVVNWSSWPETFCYAAHEAIAGGAFVLTHQGAGHVSILIGGQASKQGLVLPDEGALHRLFGDMGLFTALANAQCRRGALFPQGGTAAWLLQSAEGQSIWRKVARRRSVRALGFMSTEERECV